MTDDTPDDECPCREDPDAGTCPLCGAVYVDEGDDCPECINGRLLNPKDSDHLECPKCGLILPAEQ